jgi:riboflavin synthase
MFTGIIQAVGQVRELRDKGGDVELLVAAGGLDLSAVAVGDSISVSGACLTATRVDERGFAADVSRETLEKTTLGTLRAGSRVNLETALRAGQALGGHYVTGHVDARARVVEVREDARSRRVTVELPTGLARYVAPKGSVTIDGVSLTVNEAAGNRFGVNLIPHTCAATTLGGLAAGQAVNVEIDIIARYLERLIASPG